MPGRPFAFLDRDGTLVRDVGYAFRIRDYERLPGAVEGLRMLAEAGFGLAIVTNQSGIGRGYFSEAEFEAFQEHLLADFRSAGVEIEASFHCPHVPDAGCSCRKPATGMLERARTSLGADLERSWVIGDSPRDVALAANAGCRAVFLTDDPESPDLDSLPEGTPVASDLREAARLILADRGAAQLPQ